MASWHKYHGIKEDALSLDDYSDDMLGQNEALEEVIYRVQAGDLLFIDSSEGSGKSMLLHKLIEKFKGKKQVVYLDCSKINKDVDIKQILLERYGWWNKLVRKLPRNMIVLLDNIQKLDYKNSEAIKYYFDQGNILSVVFTSSDRAKVKFSPSLWQRIGKRIIKLRRLKPDEAVKLMKDRIGGKVLNNGVIKTLYSYSEGNIKRFIEDTAGLLKFMADNDIEDITKDEVEEKFYGKKKEPKRQEKEEQFVSENDERDSGEESGKPLVSEAGFLQ